MDADECIEALKTELGVFASWGHETQMLDKAIAKEEASIRLGKDAENEASARRHAQTVAGNAQWKAHVRAQQLAAMAELK